MSFANREMLWFLIVLVPALIVFFAWARKKRRFLISQFVQSRLLASLTVGVSDQRQILKNSLMVAAIIFVLLALARPYWESDWEEAKQQGLDIIVAVDTSRSMLATDIAPNRLDRTKLAIRDLLLKARTDRMGLVAFAGTAFLQCPLTVDEEAFQQNVNILNVDIIPEPGSDIGAAIEAALAGFEKSESTHRALIIFTDGEDHAERAEKAAEKAVKEGVHIFTVGAGTTSGELLKYQDPRGNTVYLRDNNGTPINSRLNELLLQQIAGIGKGFYLPLAGTDTMNTLYERGLAPLPRGETTARLIKSPVDRYQWPLGIAILLLVVELFISERRRPTNQAQATPSPLAAGLLIFLLATSAWATSPGSARKAYDQGEFNKSYKEYLELQKERTEDARLKYNTGAAAYKSGRYGEAIQQFTESLKSTDLELQRQGYYNLGNAKYRLGQTETTQNQDVAIDLWTEAVQDFANALDLNPDDQRAAHNKAFVEEQLMQLKKKRTQEGDRNKGNQQNNQQQQQGGEGDQKDDNGKGDSQKENGNPSPGQNSQQQQQQPGSQGEDQQNQGGGSDQQQQQQQAQGQNGEDDQPEPQDPNDQVAYFGQMTAEQAQQLLEAQKGEEKAMLFLPRNRTNQLKDPSKTW